MRKSLTYKILAAVLAAGSLGLYAAAPAAAADDYTVNKDGEIISSGNFDNVYGNGHSFTITGGKIINVYGVGNSNYDKDASGGNVTISAGTINSVGVPTYVYGGNSSRSAYNNIVNISGDAKVTGEVSGGSSSSNANNNIVNISGGSVTSVVYGGSIGVVSGGRSTDGSAHHNTVNISDGSVTSVVYGGYAKNGSAYNNIVNINGNADVTGYVLGGNSSRSAYNNIVNINGGSVTGEIRGGSSSSNANNNIVNISGGTIGTSVYAIVYGGWSTSSSANDNEIIISGSADITNAKLYGSNKTNATGNTLTINGWSGSTKSVQNFNDIAFKNINWNDEEPVLRITAGNAGGLENTTIDTIHIAGGSNINVGESLTLIKSENGNDLGLTEGNVIDTFTAGVAREGLGSTSVDTTTGEVSFKVNSIKLSSQAESAAQTRAASAAFVNQGTDLISDSLDTISRDDNYGVKTFAAVHGNRSKYDVADDIKINGWSTIVGVGNADKFDNGSEFSWGVFYENGSGNYRTYNSFNNEFFRGDGSMVYNGGGIAARYENKNGVYTEGSLRAGMLKNELDNAMRNVNGSYGYETESAYYGAHIGVGKIISLSDSSDLDIYGKFFHTYTEGDSVTIADDKFDFDSITSDRLRVGARITSNKENKFSTYYGLAYEYEFNGDADMTAQGLRADTQSLQGSSVMAEVGFNYQPTPDSPWSFDINMRGYTGERQGGSFNVQATYTF